MNNILSPMSYGDWKISNYTYDEKYFFQENDTVYIDTSLKYRYDDWDYDVAIVCTVKNDTSVTPNKYYLYAEKCMAYDPTDGYLTYFSYDTDTTYTTYRRRIGITGWFETYIRIDEDTKKIYFTSDNPDLSDTDYYIKSPKITGGSVTNQYNLVRVQKYNDTEPVTYSATYHYYIDDDEQTSQVFPYTKTSLADGESIPNFGDSGVPFLPSPPQGEYTLKYYAGNGISGTEINSPSNIIISGANVHVTAAYISDAPAPTTYTVKYWHYVDGVIQNDGDPIQESTVNSGSNAPALNSGNIPSPPSDDAYTSAYYRGKGMSGGQIQDPTTIVVTSNTDITFGYTKQADPEDPFDIKKQDLDMNILVTSFKRNDNYDYAVDIKDSDYEPAAASEYIENELFDEICSIEISKFINGQQNFIDIDSLESNQFTIPVYLNGNYSKIYYMISEYRKIEDSGYYKLYFCELLDNNYNHIPLEASLYEFCYVAVDTTRDISTPVDGGSETINKNKLVDNGIIEPNRGIANNAYCHIRTVDENIFINLTHVSNIDTIHYIKNDKTYNVYGKLNNTEGVFIIKAKNIDYSKNDYKFEVVSFNDQSSISTGDTLRLKYDINNYVRFNIDNDKTIYLQNNTSVFLFEVVMAGNYEGCKLQLKNSYTEENGQQSNPSWWTGLSQIKKGTILKITNESIPQDDSAYPFLPAYVIAKEDYTITGNGYQDYLHIGLPADWMDEDAPYGKIDTQIKISDSNIWESCVPSDPYARSKPWMFIAEGLVTDYISFQWNDKYNEPGTFSLALVATQENMDLFKEDRFLMISSSDRVMMIENVEFNVNLKSDGYIMTVSGRSIEAILERRVIFPGQGLNTNEYIGIDGMAKALYDLVDGFFMNPEKVASISLDGQKAFYYPERRIPFLTLPDENEKNELIRRIFHASINITVSKDDVLKVIQEQCKQTDLGFKIIPRKRYGSEYCIEWVFSLYTGYDKSYGRPDKTKPIMIFSPKIGNVEAISTVKDSKNYRNVIFCGVEKDSDGYIDLTKDVSSANYWGQKTGVDVIDSISSNATNLISGVKNTLVTKLEASPVCYTGMLFLALAAMRTDCSYQPTVKQIVRNDSRADVLIGTIDWEADHEDRDYSMDNPFYIVAYKNCDVINNVCHYKDKIYLQAFIEKNNDAYTRRISIIPQGENFDKIYLENPDTTAWSLTFDVEYYYINNTAYGQLIPAGLLNDYTTTNNIYIYDYPGGDDSENDRHVGYFKLNLISGKQNNPQYITAYPSDYISKEEAERITITFRQAYGDREDMVISNKYGDFKLSNVNPACKQEEYEIDFKTSTGLGWLTTPILKQAISDINNTKFSSLSMIKKSAIQAWFKTLDKYTTSKSQIRWLCQEHVQNSSLIGLDRREVFVEEDESDNTDWNASKINQWQQNSKIIAADQDEDEETDEEINEKLLKTARKKSGEYRRTREIDATLMLDEYVYDPSGNPTSSSVYTMGDIIQIDDGYGNMEKYLINGVTLSMDTTSGPKIVPSFEIYESIPKQYHKLEWLQVANMILPTKFNPVFDCVNSVAEIRLPANVYFGAMDKNRDQEIERTQDEELGGITAITYERMMKISELDFNVSYVEKDNFSNLKSNFSAISALGSYRKYSSGGRDKEILNIPMALVFSKWNSPLYFMSKNSDEKNNYSTYLYIDNGVTNVDNESYIYNLGCGYKNIYIDSTINTETKFKWYIYRNDNVTVGETNHFILNKIIEGRPMYTKNIVGNYIFDTVNDKTMYYSKSIINNENSILSYRPLSRNYYDGFKEGLPYLINESSVDRGVDNYNENYNFNYKLNVNSSGWTYHGKPNYGNNTTLRIKTEDSYWGQDNYIWSQWYKETYDRYELEGNIVIGGCGYCLYDRETNKYLLKFESGDTPKPFTNISPKSCDVTNGIRIYNLNIYETEASLRSIKFGNVDTNLILKETSKTEFSDGDYIFGKHFKVIDLNNAYWEDVKIYVGEGTASSGSDPDNRIPILIAKSAVDENGNELGDINNDNFRFDWSNDELGYPITCLAKRAGDDYILFTVDLRAGNYVAQNIPVYNNGIERISIDIICNDSTSNFPFLALGDYENSYFDGEIPAYYPDLNTRVLAHEYVPVVYVDAEEDTPDEEKYGLYDITEQTFVPVNFGSNSAGTFIAAGGEIIDQE